MLAKENYCKLGGLKFLLMGVYLDKIAGMQKGKVLGPLTTFGMGGPADYYFEVKDSMQIPALIEAAFQDGLPYIILGWGSNMTFSDQGFRGLIIHNLARKSELAEEVGASDQAVHLKSSISPEGKSVNETISGRPAGKLVVAESGTLLSQIIQFSLKHGLTGMEKLMGLPGTIGGAVRGNAGAFGLETKHLFEKCLVYREASPEARLRGEFSGELVEYDWHYLNFDYRHSRIKDSRDILLKVWLRLTPGDTAAGVDEVRKIIASRAGKHPSGKSAGSFFKNPSGNSVGEGLSAGYLNDQCGFRGKHIGGAFISEKHANFLMNDGTATMKDLLELCLQIQQAVYAKFGVKLAREVALVGEHGYIEDEFAK